MLPLSRHEAPKGFITANIGSWQILGKKNFIPWDLSCAFKKNLQGLICLVQIPIKVILARVHFGIHICFLCF